MAVQFPFQKQISEFRPRFLLAVFFWGGGGERMFWINLVLEARFKPFIWNSFRLMMFLSKQLANRSIMTCWKPLKFLYEMRNTSRSGRVSMDSRLLFSFAAMMSKFPTKFYFRTSSIPTFLFSSQSSLITMKVLSNFLFGKAHPSTRCMFTVAHSQWKGTVVIFCRRWLSVCCGWPSGNPGPVWSTNQSWRS